MVRKMVTGDAKEIKTYVKRESATVKCHGCGKDVVIMVPHTGDILCDECLKSNSYSVTIED